MTPRSRIHVATTVLLLGAGASAALLVGGATPGLVLVPLSLAFVAAVVLLPFPAADYALAVGMLGTIPLVPPVGLPNVPLAAAVIGVGLARIVGHNRGWPPWRSVAIVAIVWAFVLVGALISHWPPVSVWLRPAAILAIGLAAALLGLLVWLDRERRWRWFVALATTMLVVSLSSLVVFALQYVVPVESIVQGVIFVVGYLRGEAAATAFDAVNNWTIAGEPRIMRALSPVVPAPNGLGAFVGIGMALAAAVALNANASRRARYLAAAAMATGTVALIVTYSRSSWVATSVAVVAVGAVALLARRRGTHLAEAARQARLPSRSAVLRLTAVVLMAGAVGLAGVLTTANTRAWTRIATPSEDNSVQERIEGDAAAIERIQAGLLRGTGLGNWTGRTAADSPALGEHRAYVHNIYLEYSGATGILGGVWVVLLFAVTVVGGASAALRGAGTPSTLAGLALVSIGVFGATQGLFDDTFLNPQIAWLNAWAFGGGVAMLALARRSRDDDAPSAPGDGDRLTTGAARST